MDMNQNVMMTAMEISREEGPDALLERLIFASSNHLFGGYIQVSFFFNLH